MCVCVCGSRRHRRSRQIKHWKYQKKDDEFKGKESERTQPKENYKSKEYLFCVWFCSSHSERTHTIKQKYGCNWKRNACQTTSFVCNTFFILGLSTAINSYSTISTPIIPHNIRCQCLSQQSNASFSLVAIIKCEMCGSASIRWK